MSKVDEYFALVDRTGRRSDASQEFWAAMTLDEKRIAWARAAEGSSYARDMELGA